MIVNIGLIFSIGLFPDDAVRPVINTHKSIGIAVLGLGLMRWLWRLSHPPPPLPGRYPAWERVTSHAVHWSFYLLILAIPLTGWIMDSAWKNAAKNPLYLFGIVPFPHLGVALTAEPAVRERIHDGFGAAHMWLAYGLMGLFVLHVAGALKHQFIDREPELQRMTRPNTQI